MSFEIRAHHLSLLKTAAFSPIREATRDLITGIRIIDIFKNGYEADVMGATTTQQFGYLRRMMKHYQTFQELQDDEEVIVHASFDEYCRNSCIGAHCTEAEVNTDITQENRYTERLFTILHDHPEIDGKAQLSERITKPKQIVPEKVLITNARTLRSALSYW